MPKFFLLFVINFKFFEKDHKPAFSLLYFIIALFVMVILHNQIRISIKTELGIESELILKNGLIIRSS
jgi:hypothetical protein